MQNNNILFNVNHEKYKLDIENTILRKKLTEILKWYRKYFLAKRTLRTSIIGRVFMLTTYWKIRDKGIEDNKIRYKNYK